jgi:hypothetical protein
MAKRTNKKSTNLEINKSLENLNEVIFKLVDVLNKTKVEKRSLSEEEIKESVRSRFKRSKIRKEQAEKIRLEELINTLRNPKSYRKNLSEISKLEKEINELSLDNATSELNTLSKKDAFLVRIKELEEDLSYFQEKRLKKEKASGLKSPEKLLKEADKLSESGDYLASWIVKAYTKFKFNLSDREETLQKELDTLKKDRISELLTERDIRIKELESYNLSENYSPTKTENEKTDITSKKPSKMYPTELGNFAEYIEKLTKISEEQLKLEKSKLDIERDKENVDIQKVEVVNLPEKGEGSATASNSSFSSFSSLSTLLAFSKGKELLTKGKDLLTKTGVGSAAAKLSAKKLPFIGGAIAGGLEYLNTGNLKKSLSIGGGAIGGGAIGATIGSFIAPGIGTAIGGIAGSYIGEVISSKIYDSFSGIFDKLLEEIEITFKNILRILSKVPGLSSLSPENPLKIKQEYGEQDYIPTEKLKSVTDMGIPAKDLQKLISTEGGNVKEINPKSLTAGLYQFLPTTAAELITKIKNKNQKTELEEQILENFKEVNLNVTKNSSKEEKAKISQAIVKLNEEQQTELYKNFLGNFPKLLKEKTGRTPSFVDLKTYGFAPGAYNQALQSGDFDKPIYKKGTIQWEQNEREFNKIDMDGDNQISIKDILNYYQQQEKNTPPNNNTPKNNTVRGVEQIDGNPRITSINTPKNNTVRGVEQIDGNPRITSMSVVPLVGMAPINRITNPIADITPVLNGIKLYETAAINDLSKSSPQQPVIVNNSPTSVINNTTDADASDKDFGRDRLHTSSYNPFIRRLDTLYSV